MRKSDIFESYAKIAEEKGIVSKYEPEHTEKNTKNPRWDSLSVEQIGKLYNVKPDAPKDMEYKNNIMEDAHPDPVILFLSHDKLNSLVENEVVGQNIRMRIVMKEPDGHLTQRKYAEKQLILSLVRTATDLDNQNKDDLRVLADTCLQQATFKKKAFPFLIAAIGATLAAIYLKNHLNFHGDGFEQDYQKVNAEIDDLLESNSNMGVGISYRPEFIQTMTELKMKLGNLYAEYLRIAPILDKIQNVGSGNQLIQVAKSPVTQTIIKEIETFKEMSKAIYPEIVKYTALFGQPSFKQRQVVNKGVLSKITDIIPGLHGGNGMVADDFDDVVHALNTFKPDITNLVKALNIAETIQQNAEQEISSANGEFQKNTAPDAGSEATSPAGENVPTTTPTAGPPAPPKEEESSPSDWADIEKSLPKGLSSLIPR